MYHVHPVVHQNLFVLMGGVSHQESELFCSKIQLRDAAKSPPLMSKLRSKPTDKDPSLLMKIQASRQLGHSSPTSIKLVH